MPHPELVQEAEYVKGAYRRLGDMRERARSMMEEVLDLGRGGTHQARAERDVVVRSSLARLESLEVGDQALVFGRIDFKPGDGEFAGTSFHIGRLSVNAEDMEPLVVDWRAPVSEAFYRATAIENMGLWRRRHFLCDGDKLIDIEDELLAEGVANEGSSEHDLIGPGALFAAISRPRTQFMRDIVSTIQSEQDAIVRFRLPGVLVVQGAPGTGKTAVALHRAAYLLYTHRWRFEHQGLLVVGPSTAFVRYIQQVLPSLGESGVALHTIEGVTGYVPRKTETDALVMKVKGDPRMVKMLRKAVHDRQRPLRRDVELPFGSKYLRVPAELTERLVAAARRRHGPHNPRRRLIEAKLAELLAKIYLEGGPLVRGSSDTSNIVHLRSFEEEMSAVSVPGEEEEELIAEVSSSLKRSVEFQRIVERIWPRLSPEQFLHDLLTHEPLIELAGKTLFNREELAALAIPREHLPSDQPWSREDAVLLDEARVLLDDEDAGEVTRYAHVVIDEAQDLSPMAARMLSRRCPQGSMTVLGDLAQAFGPWAGRDWSEVVAPLRRDGEFTLVELTVNYRTPDEIVRVADVVRDRFLPGQAASKAIRSTGTGVHFVQSAPSNLVDDVRSELAKRLLSTGEGIGVVIAPSNLVEELSSVVSDLRTELDSPSLETISVMDIHTARGLEFDVVVVVEPLQLLGNTERSLRGLFVAMTRATRELSLVSSVLLPDWLEEWMIA